MIDWLVKSPTKMVPIWTQSLIKHSKGPQMCLSYYY